MLSAVSVRTFNAPEYNKKEILRYALVESATDEISGLLEDCIAELDGKLCYKVCFCECDVTRDVSGLDLSFAHTDSTALAKNLDGCDRIVLFGATVGLGIDRLVAKYARVSPSRALMLQAIGAERIESLCDAFERSLLKDMSKDGVALRPRFSPGYGDLPIELQRDVFRVLDAPKKIGLTLTESLLMSPTKSVTAIIGLEKA